MRSALKSDGELLSAEERARVETAITALQAAALAENRRQITVTMDALDAETKAFAARRMDKNIRRALAGRNIDELAGEDQS